ncbi:MAG: hypothetical protein M1831_006494 [Alyxoria varia]|nr:MAG: hypothetical protein M1831_006494 [Alyxoria varia]
MFSSWFYLRASLEGRRDLLSRYAFDDEEYALQVTDLTHVWTTSLSKADLIKQAQDEECPVEPSQDENQLHVLTTNLENGLRATCGPAGSIRVSEQKRKLLVTTECPLPSPLPALEWTWELQCMNDGGVRDQLLMPLMASNIVQSGRIDRLSEMLVEKDSVMGKILDRLDSAGVDLASIFPQTADTKGGKRGNKRLQLIRQVPAFRPYNQQEFLEQSQGLTRDSTAPREDLFNTALKDTSIRTVSHLVGELGASTESAAVVADTAGRRAPSVEEEVHQDKRSSPSRPQKVQRQSTPPPVHNINPELTSPAKVEDSNPLPTKFDEDGDTTEDETDDGPKQSTSKATEKDNEKALEDHNKAPTGGLPSRLPAQQAPASEESDMAGDQKEKATGQENEVPLQGDTVPETELEGQAPSTHSPMASRETSEPRNETPKRKSKLGRIGGKPPKGPSPIPESAITSAVPEAIANPKATRLGKIGGKKSQANAQQQQQQQQQPEQASNKADSKQPNGENVPKINETNTSRVESTNEDRSRKRNASTDVPESPKTRETSQERADRKREELKQELENKKKAQAKSKRRKF